VRLNNLCVRVEHQGAKNYFQVKDETLSHNPKRRLVPAFGREASCCHEIQFPGPGALPSMVQVSRKYDRNIVTPLNAARRSGSDDENPREQVVEAKPAVRPAVRGA